MGKYYILGASVSAIVVSSVPTPVALSYKTLPAKNLPAKNLPAQTCREAIAQSLQAQGDRHFYRAQILTTLEDFTRRSSATPEELDAALMESVRNAEARAALIGNSEVAIQAGRDSGLCD